MVYSNTSNVPHVAPSAAARQRFTCLVVANGASSAGVEGLSKQDDDNLKIARRHFESSSKATNVSKQLSSVKLAERGVES